MPNQKLLVCGCSLLLTMAISGCSAPSAIAIDKQQLPLPANWQSHNSEQNKLSVSNNQTWIKSLIQEQLANAITTALANNYNLKQQTLALAASKQSAIASGAKLWPELDLGFSNSRRKSSTTGGYSTSHELSVSLKYEVDIWGKLTASDRRANLSVASQQASLMHSRHTLIKDVILSWYKVVESKQQLSLNQQRLANTKQNLAIIESGYESGLNSALDVYLSRNEVANEQARVANQSTNLQTAIRQLEAYTGAYPAAALEVTTESLPELKGELSAGLPSEVIANNSELESKWISLMAKDAGLAYAHKQRFPSLSLTANFGISSDDLSDLLSNSIGWSLLGNITTPLFKAGQLKANEEKAKLETQQAEQAYLAALNGAFSQVENGLTKDQNLKLSYRANQQAASNANLAEQLSFEQYLKGLVSYTTVLDAQTRAFNAKSAALQSKYQMIENRVQLHLALGGKFNIDALPSTQSNSAPQSNIVSGSY